jgi:superfamily II DNA or RNA helicase
MKITLGPQILLEDAPKDLKLALEKKCSGTNPAYSFWTKRVMAQPWLRNTEPPEKILTTYSYSSLGMFVPIGLFEFIEEWCISSSVKYTISDVRVMPKLETPFEFLLTPRDFQLDAANKLKDHTDGILVAPTGSGKTALAFYLSYLLQTPVIFTVPSKVLMYQTAEECKRFLGFSPGLIGDNKYSVKDFTVAIVNSLAKKDCNDLKKRFGLYLGDEIHTSPTALFSTVPKKFYAKHRYGLTATPNRADGLHWIMYQGLGPIRHTIDIKGLQDLKTIIKPTIFKIEVPFKYSLTFDSMNRSKMLKLLENHKDRNEFICEKVKEIITSENYALILTEHSKHVDILCEILKELKPLKYYSNGLTTKEKEEAVKQMKAGRNLTIATYSSIGTGFDIPKWDTLFMASPFSSDTRTTQIIGRIIRNSPNKTSANVYDFIDVTDEFLLSQANRRSETYTKL